MQHKNPNDRQTQSQGQRQGGREKTDNTEDGEGPAGDMPGYLPMGEDQQSREAYRDWVHSNDGSHFSGGVKYDQAW